MNSPSTSIPCRVCQSPSELFYEDTRKFFKCPQCWLVFTLEMAENPVAEKHYKEQWGTADPNYWKEQVDGALEIINQYLTPTKILDFGAGSGEITHEMRIRGLNVTPLEPMINGFLKDQNFSQEFDVILAIEVIEHLPNLWEELKELNKVLVEGGIILISTALTNKFIDTPQAAESFRQWWYKDDPTHVSFFCNKTIATLGQLGGWKAEAFENIAFVLQKVHS